MFGQKSLEAALYKKQEMMQNDPTKNESPCHVKGVSSILYGSPAGAKGIFWYSPGMSKIVIGAGAPSIQSGMSSPPFWDEMRWVLRNFENI